MTIIMMITIMMTINIIMMTMLIYHYNHYNQCDYDDGDHDEEIILLKHLEYPSAVPAKD